MRLVLADDAVLLREGLVRLLTEQGHDVVAAVGDGPSLVAAGGRAPARRVHCGRTDAADPHRRGAAGRGRSPRRPARARRCWCSPSTSRCSYADDLLADRRGRDRLPAQGPGRRHRRVPRRAATGWPPAAPCSTPRWWPSCWSRRRRTTRCAADPARAGGARADGRGPLEHRDRPARSWSARARSRSTSATSSPSSTCRPTRTCTAGSSPCSPSCGPERWGITPPARRRPAGWGRPGPDLASKT